MCRDCGCGEAGRAAEGAHAHEHGHAHHHSHEHQHAHAYEHSQSREIAVERSVLELNDHLAAHNREHFAAANVLAVNVMSSPGAGKTQLLEVTLRDLRDRLKLGVIVGDLETDNDARRLRASGAPVVSVTTGTMCHLEADMIHRACDQLALAELDVLFVENVGNLVCPASFNLGEDLRVVLMSVTEGEDKPLKYPPMFKGTDLVLLTKIDLAGPAGCDLELARQNIRRVAPQAELIELSARSGAGLELWYRYLERQLADRAGKHAVPLTGSAET